MNNNLFQNAFSPFFTNNIPLTYTLNPILGYSAIPLITPYASYSPLYYYPPFLGTVSTTPTPINSLNSIQKLSLISPSSAISAINPISALSIPNKNTSN